VRRRALEFFHADPEHFDIVFVANASAAIKIVGEAMRDYVDRFNEGNPESAPKKLWYGYHKDAHNSVVGAREFTEHNSRSFCSDAEVDEWIEGLSSKNICSPTKSTTSLHDA
jgi:molybdenum cofactor sulfurtransferase